MTMIWRSVTSALSAGQRDRFFVSTFVFLCRHFQGSYFSIRANGLFGPLLAEKQLCCHSVGGFGVVDD